MALASSQAILCVQAVAVICASVSPRGEGFGAGVEMQFLIVGPGRWMCENPREKAVLLVLQ